MSQFRDGPQATFKAGGAIGLFLLVKMQTDGTIAVAGLNEEFIGTAEQQAFAAGEYIAVRLRGGGFTRKCKAAAAIVRGAVVYGRAGGLVDDDSTGALRLGIALEGAAAANDILEVL